MIDFAQPWALALLPLIPAVLWLHARRPRAAVSWPGADELGLISDKYSSHISLSLFALTLFVGNLALAGPRIVEPGESITSEGIAILLVVDVSGSMAEPDFDWEGTKIPRLEALKRGFDAFVKRRPQDRVGLILFAAQPETACPLTMDHAALLKTLNAAEPRGVPTESETNLGDAIAWGLTRLQAERGRKTMLVCSDGEHNVPAPALLPRQAGQLAAAAGVPIDTLFAGATEGTGRDGLQSIARMTGGHSWTAHDATGLQQASDELDQLERERNSDPRRLKYREGYPWLALAAAMLLICAIGYSHGPGKVLP